MWLKDQITVGMLVKATTAHDFSLVLISDLCTNGCCFWCYSQHLELKLSLQVFLFIHTSLPSLANTYLILKEGITDADTSSVAVYSCYGEDAWAVLGWGLPLLWGQGLWQGTGCRVVRGLLTTLGLLRQGTQWWLRVKSSPLFLPVKFASWNVSGSQDQSSLLPFWCKHRQKVASASSRPLLSTEA